MKKILVLGGTMFVGRAMAEKLSANREYELTLFNRGKSNANLFPSIRQIHGNRETDDILQVCDQHWDCVIDFSGYYPVSFEKLLTSLKGKVNRYIFISTISVYDLDKFGGNLVKETDPIHPCFNEKKISKLPDAYGEKKAEMERILQKEDWLDKIIFRPSFIYGKYDWTERLYYWLYRAKFFDRILMPQDFSLSLTYADDLVAGIIAAIETDAHQSMYNTITHEVSLREVVKTTAHLLNRRVEFIDADNSLLEKNDVDLSVFPLFVPMNLQIEGNKWLQDFSVSPTEFTTAISETINYHDAIGWQAPKAGLSIEKEKEILGV
jgi:2'-hydroxyisoflavone reductase